MTDEYPVKTNRYVDVALFWDVPRGACCRARQVREISNISFRATEFPTLPSETEEANLVSGPPADRFSTGSAAPSWYKFYFIGRRPSDTAAPICIKQHDFRISTGLAHEADRRH
ncbi:hypothetical protein [Burkholderia vietnamiensis]|uniref:hypothetical protein n=1 Tax=Burkholderia vietnamiensis TaxID=60552 RepID=UPI0030C7C438